MEGECFADVQVPVIPVVCSRELFIFVRDAARFQMLVELAVLRDQEVVDPAVDPHQRNQAVVDPLDQRERVLGAPLGRLAEDGEELGTALGGLVRVEPREAEGTRVRVYAAKHITVLEAELDRAVTAHREPADRTPRAFSLYRKGTVDQTDD